jgi:hypothetical protein
VVNDIMDIPEKIIKKISKYKEGKYIIENFTIEIIKPSMDELLQFSDKRYTLRFPKNDDRFWTIIVEFFNKGVIPTNEKLHKKVAERYGNNITIRNKKKVKK